VGETRRRLTQTPHLKVKPSPSLSLSLATLVTPTTSTPVQDNISIILPLVFHLASTHLGRDTQRQIHWSVEGPRGSETPTTVDWPVTSVLNVIVGPCAGCLESLHWF
jgi:hypothetical protein